LIPYSELATLDQIGAGHDGIVGRAACAGLEVVIGVRGFGAEEEQGYGKDDAGHVAPL
jgi:hypothetical protein